MKKKVDHIIYQQLTSNFNWLDLLKQKNSSIEGIVDSTTEALENVFSLNLELIKQLNIYVIKNKLTKDKIEDLTLKILEILNGIKIANIELKQEILESKKYIDKSISLISSLYKKITKDPLTGLWNKEYINNVLEILYDMENLPEFFYIFIDLDNFKSINDIYGHEVGDDMIINFANYLREIFGEENNYIARIQGDEFNIISFDKPHIVSGKINNLKNWCEKNKIPVKDKSNNLKNLSISFSLGYSNSMEAKNLAELVRLADKRMYKEKFSKKK